MLLGWYVSVELHELQATKNSRPSSQGFAERRKRKTSKREEQRCWLKLQRHDRAFATYVGLRHFAKTTMTLRIPDGTTTASRRGIEKVIHDFYSDLFDSDVHLPPHHLREDGHVIPRVLSSEVRHAREESYSTRSRKNQA
ncbi:hypothetical protein RB195_019131 [Necator americanus]|uniref:Uncharacterized protein n=1 Tax=Necator americanus TaxID=51031 RepID=A0ABR1CCS2_NECAM